MPFCEDLSHLAKYRNRNSPPASGNSPGCRGIIAYGNDGNLYKSTRRVDGIYAWKLYRVNRPKKPKKKVIRRVRPVAVEYIVVRERAAPRRRKRSTPVRRTRATRTNRVVLSSARAQAAAAIRQRANAFAPRRVATKNTARPSVAEQRRRAANFARANFTRGGGNGVNAATAAAEAARARQWEQPGPRSW